MQENKMSQMRVQACPENVYRMSDAVKAVLRRAMLRLPKRDVSETETLYPTTSAGMRAFLATFFSRHYFQIQNSLMGYISSDEFSEVMARGTVRILDVGCGPAVGSLAIIDMVAALLGTYGYTTQRPVRVDCILNDTCGLSLGTGRRMLENYFKLIRRSRNLEAGRILQIQRQFPDNIGQLNRIASNQGRYDIVLLSYVVRPLHESEGVDGLRRGLRLVEGLCDTKGRVLIVQDKYREQLMRRVGRVIGEPVKQAKLVQEVYPERGETSVRSYSYYHCLYSPQKSRNEISHAA